MNTASKMRRTRVGKPWQARLLSLLRTALTILILVQAVEWWQARGMLKGSFPEVYADLPYLEDPRTEELGHGNAEAQHRLIYVWAPWCGVCRMGASNLNNFPNTGLTLESLALSWSDENELRTFVRDTGMTIPVRIGSEDMERALGISAFPSYFLIAKDGRVLKAWSGYTTTLGLVFRGLALGLLDKA